MKKACVIGWPIKHSRSPLIHGHWLKTYGIDGSYEKVAVAPAQAAGFLSNLHANGFVGCNVTIPHKIVAFEAALVRHRSAEAVGAANTLWYEDGRLHGSNTDTEGFMEHLRASVPDWQRRVDHAVVLGAGGAARAIIYGLREAGIDQVQIFNRTLARSQELARYFGSGVTARAWEKRSTGLGRKPLLINTTSLGMTGGEDLDIDLEHLDRDSVIADIVYVPLETPLLAQARRRGLATVDGLGMLLHQAVPGFEKWFGVRPEVTTALRDVVLADLGVTG